MNTYAIPSPENTGHAIAHDVSQRQQRDTAFQFADNRSTGVAQRDLQAYANYSTQVKQLNAFQQMANESYQTAYASQLHAIANPPSEKANSQASVAQGLFVPDALNDNEKALEAYEIFAHSLPEGSASEFVRDSDFIIVEFEMSARLGKANGTTSKMVDIYDDGSVAKFENAAGKIGIENLKNKKTYITIRLNNTFVANNTAPFIAKTLAHEMGTHVAPFVEILTRLGGEEGITMEDINFLSHRSDNEGAHDHIAIRERENLDYEKIVMQMVEYLGGPENSDAQEVVYRYILDISRYDEHGMPVEDQQQVQTRARHNLQQESLSWAQPYIQNRPKPKKSYSSLTKSLILLTVILGLVSIWMGYVRKYGGDKN